MKVIVTKNYEELSKVAAGVVIDVVKANPSAILGLAAEIDDNRVDLPALGNPTRPTSASNFNSRMILRSIAGSPG